MPKTDDDKLGVLSAYEKGELKSVATKAELAKFTAYHQLGRFVVAFQRLEGAVNDLLVLLANTDDGVIRILANDLEYNKRLNSADVLFARFVDLRTNTDANMKGKFHTLMVELGKLGERRNDLVHSRYTQWLNVEGKEGLLRTNSKLRGRVGRREEVEEELQPEAFNDDLLRLAAAGADLERFRLQVIEWLYPSDGCGSSLQPTASGSD